jgi:hypothetical protein
MAGCAALHPPYVLSAQPVAEEKSMPAFRLPLSGNVTQSINPWTWFFNPVGSQVGLVNIELGQSSNPAIEEEVLGDVASYGKQLGRIEDALLVLLAHFRPDRPLTADEDAAIAALKAMAGEIAAVKTKHQPRTGS